MNVGDPLHVAGPAGLDAQMQVVDGTEAQLVQAVENLKTALTAAGATLADAVEWVTYPTDRHQFRVFAEVQDRYVSRDDRTWTAGGTPALALPGLIVDIQCTAVLSS